MTATLPILTLETEYQPTFDEMTACPSCQSTGGPCDLCDAQEAHGTCPTCDGDGITATLAQHYDDRAGQWYADDTDTPCPECDGTGTLEAL